ncbi:MAG: ATP-binding cassette domain-containing protein [Saprospiraceae bacterium]
MLTSENVSFKYSGRDLIDFPDLKLDNNAHCLILGKSGIGKTTLLHILAGLLKPTSGSVLIDDQNIYNFTSAGLDFFRGQHIGLIFQKPYFIQSINVSKNLAWAQQLSGKKPEFKRIDELLNRLQIQKHKNHLPSRLSAGEQQRASIARALVNKPSIILADEPTSSLDDENAMAVVNLLREQAEQDGASLIIVTHDVRIKEQFQHQISLGV